MRLGLLGHCNNLRLCLFPINLKENVEKKTKVGTIKRKNEGKLSYS